MAIIRNKAQLVLWLVMVWHRPTLNPQSQPDTTVAAEYGRAEALVHNHQWDEALEVLGHVLAQEPRNLKALNLAGIACAAKGDTPKADVYFERSLVVDPHFLPALRNLSISEFNSQQFQAAEKHLTTAQELLPNDPTINLYLGQIAYRQQRYRVAAERLEGAQSLLSHYPDAKAALAVSFLRSDQKPRAVELLSGLSPSDIDPHSQLELGIALLETDSNSLAVPYLQAAFDQNQGSYDIGFDLALACIRAKIYANAVTTIQDMLKSTQDTSELESLLAEALEGQGETGKAIDAYRSAIELDPKDEDNYVDFASLCIDHRAFKDGMTVITLGLRLHPDSARLTFMRGILNASEGDVDLAEQDFDQATRLAPQRELGTVGLGAVYLQKGNSEAAIKVLRDQLSKKPNDASLLSLLGQALITSGFEPGQPSYAEAQHALEQSVTLDPGLCLPHVSLGSIYLQEDRFSDAVVQFEAARRIDPNENSAYSHLAVAYRRLKQPEKAEQTLVELQKLLQLQRSGSSIKGASTSEPK